MDQNSQKLYPKIGVNVFAVKDGRILLGKRIGKRGNGTWGLPGGHLEYGESLADGAKRELEEETGLQARHLEFLHLVNDPTEESHYLHIDFLATKWEGEPKVTEPEKFAEWQWFDLEKLPEPIFIGHQKLIPAFRQKISFLDSFTQN